MKTIRTTLSLLVCIVMLLTQFAFALNESDVKESGDAGGNATEVTKTQEEASDAEVNEAETVNEEALPKEESGNDAPGGLRATGNANSVESDGTTIETVNIKWLTNDSVDNNNDNLLYLKADYNTEIGANYRFEYALSGEHNYAPGDIRITFPCKVFESRNGQALGEAKYPYPEKPDTSKNFSWEKVGDNVVFTNTKELSAATQGFIDIYTENVSPSDVQDMKIGPDIVGKIEVNTHRGNTISMSTSSINLQVDTYAEVTRVNKRVKTVDVVSKYNIPTDLQIAGETDYVVVEWEIDPDTKGAQPFTMELTDELSDDYKGFVISPRGDGVSSDNRGVTKITSSSNSTTIKTAYPASQFKAGNKYPLINNVKVTLTEKDPAIGDDPQKVTVAMDREVYYYQKNIMPDTFVNPTGHFMNSKWGNDNDKSKTAHKPDSSDSEITLTGSKLNGKGYQDQLYYGSYRKGFSRLKNNEEIEIGYTLNSIGYLLPWTLGKGENPEYISSYGKRPVTMITTDGYSGESGWKQSDLTLNSASIDAPKKLDRGTDYVFKSVVVEKPRIGKAVSKVSSDSWTYEYENDSERRNIPKVEIEALVGDSWVKVGSVDWSSGSAIATYPDGSTKRTDTLEFPENTVSYRTSVSTACAYAAYWTYPTITIKPTSHVKALLDEFEALDVDEDIYIFNYSTFEAYEDDGTRIKDDETEYIDGWGRDIIKGSSINTDIKVTPSKKAGNPFYRQETDRIGVNYDCEIIENTTLDESYTEEEVQEYIDGGDLQLSTSGVWRDLLPEGMYPDLSTLTGYGQSIKDAYVIENYKNTARNLLVVEVDKTLYLRSPNNYDQHEWRSSPNVHFTAYIDVDKWYALGGRDYSMHNVYSFESNLDQLGTVENYKAEANDARGTNNYKTKNACVDDLERDALSDVNSRKTNSFVYAGVSSKYDRPVAAASSLHKKVMVNDDTIWSQGTYDDVRTAVEGSLYRYRLQFVSNKATKTKDIILYDSLENFHAGAGNDANDIDAPRWRGKYNSVDLSNLEKAGIAPIVYYSTVSELDLSDDNNLKLSKSDIWQKTPPSDLSKVHAVAIDCRKKADGSDFVLDEEKYLSAEIVMRAPYGDSAWDPDYDAGLTARDYIDKAAHAYNNVYMTATTSALDGSGERPHSIHFDYTKVGLVENKVHVKKHWNDNDNVDLIRPESVHVILLANGEPIGKEADLSDDNDWSATFENLPYVDEQGENILYTAKEIDAVAGYTTTYNTSFDTLGNRTLNIINRHKPTNPNASGTLELDALKKVSGGLKLEADNYIFELLDDKDFVMRSVKNNGEGVIEFKNIGHPGYRYTVPFTHKDHGKVFTYKIRERIPGIKDSGVAYDDHEEIIKVTPKNNGDGTMSFDVEYDEDGAVFTNEYRAEGTLALKAKKVLEGRDLENEEFEFEIVNKDNEVVSTGKNNGQGDIVFTPLKFTQKDAGKVELIMREVKGQDATINYSEQEFPFEIDVIDNGNGVISFDKETTTMIDPDVEPVVFKMDSTYELYGNCINGENVGLVKSAEGATADSVSVFSGGEYKGDMTLINDGDIITSYNGYSDLYTGESEGHTKQDIIDYLDEKGRPVPVSEEISNSSYTYKIGDNIKSGLYGSYECGFIYVYTPTKAVAPEYEYTLPVFNNSVKNETIEIDVEKIWQDSDNQDGMRPDSITVNLLADGAKVDSKEVSAEDDWKCRFTGLPKDKDGEEIKYTVEEEKVDFYNDPVIEGSAGEGFTITNSIEFWTDAETTGEKTWVDNNDELGLRPESITVKLYADGEYVDSVTVTAENDWAYSFGNLPKYLDGKEIKYTVEEEPVEGYEATYDGFNITNECTQEKPFTMLSGTIKKEWDDSRNKDGIRPKSVKVHILDGNGETVESFVLSEKNSWSFEIKDLPEFDEDGKKIEYSIYEEPVKGYKFTEVKSGGNDTMIMVNTIEKIEKEKKTGGGAKTGDSNDMTIFIGLFAACAAALAVTVVARRRKEY